MSEVLKSWYILILLFFSGYTPPLNKQRSIFQFPSFIGIASASQSEFTWVNKFDGDLHLSHDNNQGGVNRSTHKGPHIFLGGRSLSGRKKLQEADSCSGFDGDHVECRLERPCYYNCADMTCNHPTIRPETYCPACSRFCHDVCGCKTSNENCQYQVSGGNCRPTNPGSTGGNLRPCHCAEFDNWECGRPNEIYVFGGELCKNTIPRGICTVDHTVIAINLGCTRTTVSKTGISYKADFETDYIDPFNTRSVEVLGTVQGVTTPGEELLFEKVIAGKTEKRGKDRCITYLVTLCDDGWHELTIHLIDHQSNGPGERLFNVKFNGVVILPEIDIYRTTGCKSCPLSIHQNFKVVHQGSILKLKGHKDTYIPVNGQVPLSFCYGECNVKNTNYITAGFSVVRFIQHEDVQQRQKKLPRVSYNSININQTSSLNCAPHSGKHCDCRAAGCEVNTASDICVPLKCCNVKSAQCNMHADMRCRRENAFYLDGGALCWNVKQSGDCTITEVYTGIKTNWEVGKTYKDSRGVTHTHEKTYIDPGQIRQTIDPNTQLKRCNWDKIPNQKDLILYQTQIHGNPFKRGKDCLSYPLGRLNQNGEYELSLKFLEYFFKSDDKKRSFFVKVNEIVILSEFNIYGLVGNCRPLEVIVPIEVLQGGEFIKIEGFQPFKQDKNGLLLTFCYGTCFHGNGNIGDFIINSFYLAKIGEDMGETCTPPGPPGPENKCYKHGNAHCKCKQAGCEVSIAKESCEMLETCAQKWTECVGGQLMYYDGCLRKGAYYSDGAALCKSEEDQGACEIDQLLVAINFPLDNNMTITDSRGITYHYAKEMYDPFGTAVYEDIKLWEKECGGLQNIPEQDRDLYKYQMTAKHKLRDPHHCLEVILPRPNITGSYELVFKFMEMAVKLSEKWFRTFTVKINGFIVIKDINIKSYVGFCNPMEVIVPFDVYDMGDKIEFKGFPPVENQRRPMSLEFCYGHCEYSNWGSWVVGGVYVALLADNSISDSNKK